MKTLTDGQEIRVNINTSRVLVGTVEGYAKKHNDSVVEALALARKFGHDLAYTVTCGLCITSNYPGKAEALAKKFADTAAAPLIENGETVIIEGRTYTAKYTRDWVSDPVHFLPVVA
jgi:hypothetical protein